LVSLSRILKPSNSGEIVGDSGIKRVYNDVLLLGNFHDCEVAVKMLPPFADETSKNDFQKVMLENRT
jgi:hypothetical protein